MQIELRPLTLADRSLYLAGLEHIGAESRRLRFHAAKPWMSESEIRYFTEIDHREHEAVIAVVEGALAAVARYIRDREDRRLADVAVVVVDEWQRHSVGTAVLRRLIERAEQEGIERLRASVLLENRGMFSTFRRLGLRWRTLSYGYGVAELEIPLPGAVTRPTAAPRLLPAVVEAVTLVA